MLLFLRYVRLKTPIWDERRCWQATNRLLSSQLGICIGYVPMSKYNSTTQPRWKYEFAL